MSDNLNLGDFSPELQRLANSLEELEINADTPPIPNRNPEDVYRRDLQDEFDNEDDDRVQPVEEIAMTRTATPPDEGRGSTSIDLSQVLAYFQTDAGKATLAQEGVDVEAMLTALNPTTKTVRFDTSTPRKTKRKEDLSQLHESAIKQHNRLSETTGSSKFHPEDSSIKPIKLSSQKYSTIKIDGRELNITDKPISTADFDPRIFDKTGRDKWDAKQTQDFIKGATGYVLAKNNKLALTTLPTGTEDSVKHVRCLQNQLQKLKRHFTKYDIVDVFTIVTPKDVATSNELLQTDSYDLFESFQVLHVTQVANSNAWFKMYCTNSYIAENMSYSYACLENNTEDKLWDHCQSLYVQYSEAQQGGPLMLILLLKQIVNSSETAIEDLLTNFRTLKISDIEGEDVNEMVLQLRTVYETLVGASTSTRNYVPTNFCQDVLKVLQTSSCSEFNEIFEDEYKSVTRAAARKGGLTQWPDVEEMFALATNSYADLNKQSDMWCLPTGSPGAFNATGTPLPYYMRPGFVCFNCGKGGHPLSQCPKPADEARIKKARDAYQAAHPRKSKSKSKSRPKHTTGTSGKYKGKPLVLNKNGVYVVDTKKWKAMKDGSSDSSTPPATPPATSESQSESKSTPPSGLSASDLKALKAFHSEHKDELKAMAEATPSPSTPAEIASILAKL